MSTALTSDAAFALSLKLGKVGEVAVTEYFNSIGASWVDVSDNPFYQGKDIDFLVELKNGTKRSVEVKTDTNSRSANFFFESVSNEEYDKPGWIHTTEADIVVYYFCNGYAANEHNAFFIDMRRLWVFLTDNAGSLREVTNSKYAQKYGSIRTRTQKGYLVPYRMMLEAGVLTSSHAWKKLGQLNEAEASLRQK